MSCISTTSFLHRMLLLLASEKQSTGLEDIQIDVRSKFEMFENYKENKDKEEKDKDDGPTPVKRSASVLARLAKYEGSGDQNGVPNDELGDVEGFEESEEDENNGNDVIRAEIKKKVGITLRLIFDVNEI